MIVLPFSALGATIRAVPPAVKGTAGSVIARGLAAERQGRWADEDMSDPSSPLFSPAVFPFVSVGLWVLVSNILSVVGGWRALAQSYRATSRPEGNSFSFRSAKLGLVDYGSCLRFVTTRAGLFVSVLPPFRLGHPPLFVPWPDLSATNHRGWLLRYIDLRFAQQPHVRVRISRGLAEKLVADAGLALRLPDGD